eukprot:13892.XXX_342885_343563_1 [CDS] Oithona nana genome sequencing.
MLHMPPSNDSGFHEIGNISPMSVESNNNEDLPPINIRGDIGLSDQELVMQCTKALNKLIKKKGISKERARQIKQERRTLKNRGYAANCRVKREKEEKNLEVANDDLRKEIYAKRVRAQEIRQDAQNMKDEMRRVLRELEQMEEEELMIKRQISAATNGEMSRLGSLMTDVKLEKVSDDDDPVIEHHQLQEVATNDVPFRIRT